MYRSTSIQRSQRGRHQQQQQQQQRQQRGALHSPAELVRQPHRGSTVLHCRHYTLHSTAVQYTANTTRCTAWQNSTLQMHGRTVCMAVKYTANTARCSARQCSTVEYSTVQYNTVQYSTLQMHGSAVYMAVQYAWQYSMHGSTLCMAVQYAWQYRTLQTLHVVARRRQGGSTAPTRPQKHAHVNPKTCPRTKQP